MNLHSTARSWIDIFPDFDGVTEGIGKQNIANLDASFPLEVELFTFIACVLVPVPDCLHYLDSLRI